MSISAATPATSFIHSQGNEPLFAANYNRKPFELEHYLHEHPLFQLPRLLETARRLSAMPGKLYYNVGDREIKRGWDLTESRPFSVAEALDRIESAKAWMILKSVQTIPEYGEVLDSVLREIHAASGKPFEGATLQHNMSVILTSPGRVTPYHIDADCNYLLQLRGTKTAYVFDGTDPEILTSEELERFYAGNINAAIYRESVQPKAFTFLMRPGMGIHVPVTCPHWVKNDDNISVSVSINFYLADKRIPDLYRVNRMLRRIHLNPSRPGTSRFKDQLKLVAARMARHTTHR
jgi:hypothetical protein